MAGFYSESKANSKHAKNERLQFLNGENTATGYLVVMKWMRISRFNFEDSLSKLYFSIDLIVCVCIDMFSLVCD